MNTRRKRHAPLRLIDTVSRLLKLAAGNAKASRSGSSARSVYQPPLLAAAPPAAVPALPLPAEMPGEGVRVAGVLMHMAAVLMVELRLRLPVVAPADVAHGSEDGRIGIGIWQCSGVILRSVKRVERTRRRREGDGESSEMPSSSVRP